MSFEDEVLARTEAAVQSQLDLEAAERAAEQEVVNQQNDVEAKKARLIEIGGDASRLLLAASVPTKPIWNAVEYGDVISTSHPSLHGSYMTTGRRRALDVVGEGWHLISVHYHDSEGYSYEDRYSLSTEGIFAKFGSLVHPNYLDPRTNIKTSIEGIIRPDQFRTLDSDLRLAESAIFLDAVAYMRQTGKTYRSGLK